MSRRAIRPLTLAEAIQYGDDAGRLQRQGAQQDLYDGFALAIAQRSDEAPIQDRQAIRVGDRRGCRRVDRSETWPSCAREKIGCAIKARTTRSANRRRSLRSAVGGR